MALAALFFVISEPNHRLEHAVGGKMFPYVLGGVPAALVIVAWALYGRVRSKFDIRLGIIAWILTFSILAWFFWFGPGALRSSVFP